MMSVSYFPVKFISIIPVPGNRLLRLMSSNMFLTDMNEENSPLPSTELILKIVLLSQSANNEVKVKCSGSLYYFSSNFEFAVEKLNGSVEILNRGLILLIYNLSVIESIES